MKKTVTVKEMNVSITSENEIEICYKFVDGSGISEILDFDNLGDQYPTAYNRWWDLGGRMLTPITRQEAIERYGELKAPKQMIIDGVQIERFIF